MPPDYLQNGMDNRGHPHQDVSGVPSPNHGLRRSPPDVTKSSVESSEKPTAAHIPFLDRLRILPEVRPIPWRPGQELPPEKSTESPRVQQRGATLLSTRGYPAVTPCKSCAAGNGRFSICITLQNWFQGACSSCVFTSKGNKCSLRSQTSGNADGRALRYHTENPEVFQSFIREAAENPKPAKKRKRRSAPTEPSVDTSYSQLSPQTRPPQPNSPDLDTLLQAEIAREQEEPAKTKQKRQSKSLPNFRYDMTDCTTKNGPHHSHNGASSMISSYASKQRDALRHFNKQKPSAPMNHIYHQPSNAQETFTPVIDTFPKAKQRQVYGFVNGLQNGIRNLQKDLESLRALLGIDDDDPISSY